MDFTNSCSSGRADGARRPDNAEMFLARSRHAAAIATMPATFSVPGRRPRSWLPPRSIGVQRVPLRTTSAPTPFGPWNLCAESETRFAPIVRMSNGTLPMPWTASMCSGTFLLVAHFGDMLDRMHHAGFVVGEHDRDERGVVADRVAQRVHVEAARAVDAEIRNAVARRLEALDGIQHGGVFDLRGDDVALIAARIHDTADGEVVRLGAAAREDDLGLRRSRESRQARARVAERFGGTVAQVVPAGRDSRNARCRTAAWIRTRPGPPGWWRYYRDKPFAW